MEALRIVVAHGDEPVRKGLCAFVREQTGWELAAAACNGREAVEFIGRLEPEVAILDRRMPLLNGQDATKQIAKSGSSTKVLLVTLDNTEAPIKEASQAGAQEYLLKSDTMHDLIAAVEAL